MATAAVERYSQTLFDNNPIFIKKNHFYEPQQHHHHGAVVAKQLIGDALRQRVENIDHELCEPGDEDTFFVGDLGEVYRQHMRWKKNLPRVKPFYGKFSVKYHLSNPDSKLTSMCSRQVQPRS